MEVMMRIKTKEASDFYLKHLFFMSLILSFPLFLSFESANGIKAEEMGDVKNKGSENAIQTAQGSYSYTSPEGQVVQV
jgi:Insect cuticle protein